MKPYIFGEWLRTKRQLWYERTGTVAFGLALIVGCTTYFFFCDWWKTLGWTDLQRKYWRQYLAAVKLSGRTEKMPYEFVLLERPVPPTSATRSPSNLKLEERLATQLDFGRDGKLVDDLAETGWRVRRKTTELTSQEAYWVMRRQVYEGKGPLRMHLVPILAGAGWWLVFMAGFLWWDHRDRKEAPANKVLRGTLKITPDEFNRTVKGDGLGIPFLRKPEGPIDFMKIRKGDLQEPILVVADVRQGKSVLFNYWLTQSIGLGERNLCYDPSLEFWEFHADKQRGDILLHPFYKNCPFWDLAGEIETEADALELAASFLPDKEIGRASCRERV